MTKHLEVRFDNNGAVQNATVQLDTNGAYVTLEGKPTVYIERRHGGSIHQDMERSPAGETLMVHRRFYIGMLLVTVLSFPVIAQSQAELSPAVNVHCSNTILRAYGSSTDDAKHISDQELEDLSNELSEVCKPVPGWTTKDQLYRALALNGVLSERLLRSMTSDTEHMQEATRLVAEVKALRSENERLRDQTKKDPSH